MMFQFEVVWSPWKVCRTLKIIQFFHLYFEFLCDNESNPLLCVTLEFSVEQLKSIEDTVKQLSNEVVKNNLITEAQREKAEELLKKLIKRLFDGHMIQGTRFCLLAVKAVTAFGLPLMCFTSDSLFHFKSL